MRANRLYINFGTAPRFGSLLPFVERNKSNCLVSNGDHRRQSQQSRLELGLRVSAFDFILVLFSFVHAAATTHVLSTAGEIIIASKRIRLSCQPAVRAHH
jgi:hypothetical protein